MKKTLWTLRGVRLNVGVAGGNEASVPSNALENTDSSTKPPNKISWWYSCLICETAKRILCKELHPLHCVSWFWKKKPDIDTGKSKHEEKINFYFLQSKQIYVSFECVWGVEAFNLNIQNWNPLYFQDVLIWKK